MLTLNQVDHLEDHLEKINLLLEEGLRCCYGLWLLLFSFEREQIVQENPVEILNDCVKHYFVHQFKIGSLQLHLVLSCVVVTLEQGVEVCKVNLPFYSSFAAVKDHEDEDELGELEAAPLLLFVEELKNSMNHKI